MSTNVPSAIGKYVILGELGRGATSSVYRARDTFAERDVAIKLFNHAVADPSIGGEHRSAFLTEAALVGKLEHPHIVSLLDAAVEDEFSYVVMDYVAGGTLAQYAVMDNLLPLERVVEVVFKCSRALEYAHRMGIIHRDIKPANILVTEDFDVKLADFGVAQLEEATHTNIGNAGSPAYMSPEQLTDRDLTHQTDIYSLGVVMFQLLTGRLPFSASSQASLMYQIVNHEAPLISELRQNLPAAVEAIVAKAMEKETAQRYQNWTEFGKDLASLFRELEAPREDFSETRKFHLLRNLSFFRDFRDVEIWETLRISGWRHVPGNRFIIQEGERGDGFFILVDGRSDVTREKHLLAGLGPGDCFGEMLYFSSETALRSTTIRSTTPVLVLEIKAAALSAASDACQVQFNKSFMRILIERLSAANKRLAERAAEL
jgi:eukaryotic-like serine/threonine-protein kinase